ncbi:MAG: hypothetical protein WD355_09015 [Balneolaceae bacterium]
MNRNKQINSEAMKKVLARPEDNRIIRLAVLPLLCFLFAVTGTLTAQTGLYTRAPDVIPGTTPEMRTPEYWIHSLENAEEVVMAPAQILEMNRRYQQRVLDIQESDSDTGNRVRQQLSGTPGLYAYRPGIHALSPGELAETIREMVDGQIGVLRRRSYANLLGVEYAGHELEALENEMSRNAIPDEIHLKPGITVADTRIRIIPALRPEYVGLMQTGKTRWDVWNLDVLPIASPVQVLHISGSGAHLFVFSDYGFGWVPSEQIAFASQADIDAISGSDRFVVSTGDRVPIYSGTDYNVVSGWMRMGSRLPVSGSGSELTVTVPVRQINGGLEMQSGWLRPDAEVHIGPLPYTRENVIRLGFRMLDNLYDWTGGWYGRNDGTVLRDIFKTFGFEIPANGVLLSIFSENNRVSPADAGREERYQEMTESDPFTTFMASRSGHSLLYMGELDGVPVVFDTHGYGYEENGEEIEVRRWSVATLSLPDYLLRQDVTITDIR